MNGSTETFENAWKSLRAINDCYLSADLLLERIGPVDTEEAGMAGVLRSRLEQLGRIQRIADVGGPRVDSVAGWYRDDRVGAVDGTRAMDPLNFSFRTACAFGVVAITSQRAGEPVVEMAEMGAPASPLPDDADLADLTLREIHHAVQRVRTEPSWVTTTQEALVREQARKLAEAGCALVLVDGPVATQNLLSQRIGRDDILAPLVSADACVIGFYKNISEIPLHSWVGIVLNPGEMYVEQDYVGLLADEDGRFSENTEIRRWVSRYLGQPNPFVRVIYKIRNKAFGIECRAADVPVAAAVLLVDASPTVNHELPRLIEIADIRVRRTYRGRDMHSAVLQRVQQRNLSLAAAMTDEREYR